MAATNSNPVSGSAGTVMDILRHGPDVVVIEPQSLVDEVKTQIAGDYGALRTGIVDPLNH